MSEQADADHAVDSRRNKPSNFSGRKSQFCWYIFLTLILQNFDIKINCTGS